MCGVLLGRSAERVARDDLLPFLRRADEELRSKAEALLGLGLQEALQVSWPGVAAEEEVAALEERSCVREPQAGKEAAQVGHCDHPIACDIDAPEQGHVYGHAGGYLTGLSAGQNFSKPLKLPAGPSARQSSPVDAKAAKLAATRLSLSTVQPAPSPALAQ